MKSLNSIYEQDQLHYWCNAVGEINLKEDPFRIGDKEALPEMAQELYDSYWSEGSGCNMYVAEYSNLTGMILCILCDYSWASDMLSKKESELDAHDKHALYRAAKAQGLAVEAWISEAFPGAGIEVWLGEDTDPDGHELLVFIPYQARVHIEEIAGVLNQTAYEKIEFYYKKAVSSRNIKQLLDLSSVHVSPATFLWLKEQADDPDSPLIVYALKYGWLLNTDFVDCEDDARIVTIPDDLLACIRLARSESCSWLILDSDADEDGLLPTYREAWDQYLL